MVTKGVANVRRDCPPIAREFLKKLFVLMTECPGDAKKLLEPALEALAHLTDPDLDIAELQRSQARKAEYNAPHTSQVHLFAKLEERANVAFQAGDRAYSIK